MQQPISWRIGVVATYRAQRSTRDKADHPPKQSQFLRVQGARFSPRRDPCPPENLIRHPVSNPGKAALQEKHSLNRRPGVSPNELAHYALAEFRRMDFRRAFRPPLWRLFPVMETNPTKLPGVAKDQCLQFLLEHEVIVLSRFKPSRLSAEIATHSEMNAEPVLAGEEEQHLFAAGDRAEKALPDELVLQLTDVATAKDPVLAMQSNREDVLSDPDVPSFPKIFDLGQLRHGRRLDRSWPPCYPWRAWKKSSSSEAVAPA